MKILSIGNSFSQDAHKWLHNIAESDNYDLDTVNLFIPGCSLETHSNNLTNNEPTYDMQGNSGEFIRKTTINEALQYDNYDIITLQQVSALSGKIETYFPYIENIIGFVKEVQPKSDILLHRTWSYEIDFNHPCFNNYNYDQQQMFSEICDTTNQVSEMFDIGVIPVGDIIQKLRDESVGFNYKNGGISLCRDGFHLSLDYGRFTAAAAWYRFLTGREINYKTFQKSNQQFDVKLLSEICETILKLI